MEQPHGQQGPVRPQVLIASLFAYILFAAYLSWPHWSDWTWSERTLPLCWSMGALGVFLLSRRWIRSWIGAFLSGTLYSFGPLALYTAHFHEAGACIVAIIPWLLCPWAFSYLLVSRKRAWLWHAVNAVLFAIPFLFVAVLFRIPLHRLPPRARRARWAPVEPRPGAPGRDGPLADRRRSRRRRNHNRWA